MSFPSASGPPSVALVRMYCTLFGRLILARSLRISRLVSIPVAVAAFILLRNLARDIYRKP